MNTPSADAMTAMTTATTATAIAAHRGASEKAPENTLAAVRLAWEVGSDAVEVDVRLTRDGEVVVMHDPTTGRTAGEDHPVASLSFAELRKLDAGSPKGPEWKGEPIPSLKEILATVPDGKRIFVEIKDTGAILQPLKAVLEASGLAAGQIVLILFDYDLALETRALFPDYTVLWLTNAYRMTDLAEWPRLTRELGEKVRHGRFDGIDVGVGFCKEVAQAEAMVSELRTLRASGLEVWVWTVNDVGLAAQMFETPVHGITTDAPDRVLALREQSAAQP